MHDRRPIVGGNWKMNTDLASAVELADDIVAACSGFEMPCDIAVFPPFPYLQAVGRTLGHHEIQLGAQDVYFEANGAFTGEVSVEMLADLSVSVVLVGHSERRHVLGEDDAIVNRKLTAALAGGLGVVLCVGETIEQREAGGTESVVLEQLDRGLEGVDDEQMRQVTIAYEPVWAIGTGMTATPADAESVHARVRKALEERYDVRLAESVRIQYGGSVKPANAAELFAQPNIDGGLIGGASLDSDSFSAIVRAASEAVQGQPRG